MSAATLGPWGGLAIGGASAPCLGAGPHISAVRIGGFTGDTLGALVEVTEASVLTLAVSLDFLELP